MITEPPCARLLAQRRTDEDIDDAHRGGRAAQGRGRTPASRSSPTRTPGRNLTYRFHELILQGCGNQTLAIQGAVLQDIVATHLRTKIAQGYDHRPLRALPAGDPLLHDASST